MIVLIVFSNPLSLVEDIMKLNIPVLNPHMRESVYGRVLFSLLDAVVCFVSEAGVDNILTEMRYSPVLAHSVVPSFSEIYWTRPYWSGLE